MIIYRYLSTQLLSATLGVGFVLSLVIISGRFLTHMAEAANGRIEGLAIILVLFYRLPEFMVLILPLSLFLGVLLSYGRMYVEYEMVVLKASGVGQWQLVKLSLIPAICMSLLVGYLSLVLSPQGYVNSSKILVHQYNRSSLELLTPGNFFTADKGEVLYVERLNNDKTELTGFFSSKKSANEFVTIIAENGRRTIDAISGEQFLELNNGIRYEIHQDTAKFSELFFDNYRFKLKGPDGKRIKNKLQSTPTVELWSSENLEERSELQWRMSIIPLSIIITLLAIPLSKVNPRQGRFLKLIPAIMIYLSYVAAMVLAKDAVTKGTLSPMPGIWLVHAVYFLLALLLLEWDLIYSKFNQFRYSRKARKITHSENQA